MILPLLALLYTFNSLAQTKSETEDFIKKYIEAYPQTNGIHGEQAEVKIQDTKDFGYCIFYMNRIPDIGHFMYRFEPKHIQSIVLDRNSYESNVSLRIKLKPNTYAAYKTIGHGEMEYQNSFEILLGDSSMNDQIPQRLKKSIEHLSNLTGGSITVDKF